MSNHSSNDVVVRHRHHHVHSYSVDKTKDNLNSKSREEMIPRTPPPQHKLSANDKPPKKNIMTESEQSRIEEVEPKFQSIPLVDQFEVGSDDGESDSEENQSPIRSARTAKSDEVGSFHLSNKSSKLIENMRKRVEQRKKKSNMEKSNNDTATKVNDQPELLETSEVSIMRKSKERKVEESSDINDNRLSKMIHRFRHAPPMSNLRRERAPEAFLVQNDEPAEKIPNTKGWWEYEINQPQTAQSTNFSNRLASVLDMDVSLRSLVSLSSSDEDSKRKFEERYHPSHFRNHSQSMVPPVQASLQSSISSIRSSTNQSEDLEMALERIKNNFKNQQQKEIIRTRFNNSESDEYMNSLLYRAQQLLSSGDSFSLSSSNNSYSSIHSVHSPKKDFPNTYTLPVAQEEENLVETSVSTSTTLNQSPHLVEEGTQMEFDLVSDPSVSQLDTPIDCNPNDSFERVDISVQVDLMNATDFVTETPKKEDKIEEDVPHQIEENEEFGLTEEQVQLYRERINDDKVCQLLLQKIQSLESRLAELEVNPPKTPLTAK